MSKQRAITGDDVSIDRDHSPLGWKNGNAALAAIDQPHSDAAGDEAVRPDAAAPAVPASETADDPPPSDEAPDEASGETAEAAGDEPSGEDGADEARDTPRSQHVAQEGRATDQEGLAIDMALLAPSDEPLDLTPLTDATLPISAQHTPAPRGESEIYLPHDLIAFGPSSFGRPSHAGGGRKKGGGDDNDGPEVLSSYTSGGAANSSYNITIKFKGGDWSAELQKAFIDASNWISGTIEADVIDAFFRGKIIDDIQIDATVQAIDGTGGVLGQAGPTAIRQAEYDYLPAKAVMTFDVADAQDLLSGSFAGLWGGVVLHEMLHSVGVGTLWDLQGLVDGSGTSTPTFTGDQAVLAYWDLFSGSGGVPLESGYGPGTDESHWDEALFGNELMTGFIDVGPAGNYVSGMTVASLADIGYAVNTSSYDQQIELFV